MDIKALRIVELEEWEIDASLGERIERLLNVPTPMDLVQSMVTQGLAAAERKEVRLCWQEACESPGYFRLIAYIPLSEEVFDQLFNGRSGYRAQYYLSPEEGVLFNRLLLDALVPIIRRAYDSNEIEAELNALESSLAAPHAKLWVYDEKSAFDAAVPNSLNPARWVQNGVTRGRKAPLPHHCTVDVKGSFIEPNTGKIFVDEYKLERPLDLFNRGYT
ncbi:MAG: hypothetical protein R3F53_23790 [Gammaproteobacteria bacterium]